MDKNLTGIQREHFTSFNLCHFAARLLLFLPAVKYCDVGGTVYSCIIKAEPLRVINTLQKSCNTLSLSLAFFPKQSLALTLHKNVATAREKHLLQGLAQACACAPAMLACTAACM